VHKALKKFARSIAERAAQPRELAALLGELSSLQQQALASLSSPDSARPGLLQRLFGRHDNAAAAAETAPGVTVAPPPATATPAATAELSPVPPPAEPPEPPVPGRSAAALPDVLAAAAETMAEAAADREDEAGRDTSVADASLAEVDPSYALPERPEPGYSAVAPHIGDSLLGLLDELELPAYHRPQSDALRQRVRGGLNWYELVPVLDDLAVLVLAVTDSGQREFASYLKQLNERLAAFLGTLNEAHEGYSESVESARSFNLELREQVSSLQASVQEAADLPSLKQSLETRLDGLLQTVSEHQRHRDGREEEVALRLQALGQKVSEMEQEAQNFRDHLEEQRQKALIDPLTGLANRAGWSERLELEMARWKRYGGELLLAVLDIDHFKRINDSYGHLAGDKVLKIIAGELAKRMRKTDFIARFGGEEFVLLIPSTPLDGGRQLLQTLLDGVEQCPFHFRGERVVITLSAGLSAFNLDADSSDKVFERADQALYRAKSGGRNRVELG
jgi:diguanylate cyclase